MTKEQVFEQCTVEGNVVKLPDVQLDRKLYLEVKKSMDLIGGKWKGGKVAGFVFPTDPTDYLEKITGGDTVNLKKDFQFFATPPSLAKELVDYACVEGWERILEPSAGQGAIIEAINEAGGQTPDCYELMDLNLEILNKRKMDGELDFNLLGKDFLQNDGSTYDLIIANPPFTKNQDIEHIMEMYKLLEPGAGRLVTVSSKSWETGTQKKQTAFREFLDEVGADVIPVEPGTFKESGTMVGANIIIIDK